MIKMKKVEKTAKTVDEAIALALKELMVNKEDVEVQVIEEPTKALFGLIGGKPAKVLVTVKDKPIDIAKEFLNNVFESMGLVVKLEVEETSEYIAINLTGDDLGILIGRRGETLDSLQYLLNLAVNRKFEDRTRIIVDVEGYRKRREQTLQDLAFRLADKVRRKRRDVVLEPMNPQERRVIHTALQNEKDINTFSEGEEPYRKIVISLKK